MAKGIVAMICISPAAGEAMQSVNEVLAIAGKGLEGDRYARNIGSFSKQKSGNRQVTLINGKFFESSTFKYKESRRNIITLGVELMWLIGRDFQIGEAVMRGVKYCDPCTRPSKLADKKKSFKEEFQDCGGLVAEIIEGGLIRVQDSIIPPPKDY